MSVGLSWNLPFVVLAAHSALALSGALSVTVIGHNFATTGPSASSRVGRTAPLVSSWNSASAVLCKVSSNVFLPKTQIAISVVSAFSSLVEVTFLAPSVSAINNINKPATGSTSVSIFGNNYATFDATSRVRLGDSAALSSNWVSDSCVFVRIPHIQAKAVFVTASVVF
jgi:hypothetical protein